MRILALFLTTVSLFGAVSIRPESVAHNKATFVVSGAAGSLTFELRENSATGTRLTDTETSIVTNSRTNGDTLVQVGNAPYWLELGTQHFLKVTDSVASTSSLLFTTKSLPHSVVSMPPRVDYDSNYWNGLKYPSFTWANRFQKRIGPNGVALRVLNAKNDFSWTDGPWKFGWASCGAGWTNCDNATTAGASLATVTSTNPMQLYFRSDSWNFSSTSEMIAFADAFGAARAVEDIGLTVWKGTVASTASNNDQFDVCLAVHGNCTGTHLTIALGATAGSPTQVLNTANTTDANKPWPDCYPCDEPFGGWGVRVTRDLWPRASKAQMDFNMSGSAVVPSADPDGTGRVILIPDFYATRMCYSMSVADIASATSATINNAASGSNGSVVATLTPPSSGFSSGCASMTSSLLNDMVTNPANYYVVVSNSVYPSGAVRGQLAWSGVNLSSSSGVVTFGSGMTKDYHFPPLANGDVIRLNGVNKTVSAFTHAGSLTLTDGSYSGSYLTGDYSPISIKITPLTSSSKQVSFGWKGHGSNVNPTVAEGAKFHTVASADANGVVGHAWTSPSGKLMWSDDEGKLAPKVIGQFVIPRSQFSGAPASETPQGAYERCPRVSFSSTDGKKFYCTMSSEAGKLAIWTLTYTGNWTTENTYPDSQSVFNSGGSASDGMTWTILNTDLGGLVKTYAATKGITWDSTYDSLYGSWDNALNYGVSNDHIQLALLKGQDRGPCWVTIIKVSTAQVRMLTYTLDGRPDTAPEMSGATCHAFAANPAPDVFLYGFNRIGAFATSNSNTFQEGPFKVTFTHKLASDGTTWLTDTSLPPPPYTAISHYNACPADKVAYVISRGRDPNTSCAAMRGPRSCNKYPSTTELSMFGSTGCPDGTWGASYQIEAGNNIKDLGPVAEQESMEVLKVTTLGTNDYRYDLLRDTSDDYNCHASRGFTNCLGNDLQHTHAAGWTGDLDSRGGGYGYFGNVTPEYARVFYDLAGHSTMGPFGNGNISFIGGSLIKYNVPFGSIDDLPITGNKVVSPKHAGVSMPVGSLSQQYLNYTSFAAERNVAVDFNHLNPGLGVSNGNTFDLSIGDTGRVSVSGNVYRLNVIGSGDYRTTGYNGWYGHRVLTDISSPTANITTAANGTMCVNYRAGINCGVGGSTVGQVFINVANVYTPSTNCYTGMIWAINPCVTAIPGAGWARRLYIDDYDLNGSRTELLDPAMGGPGLQVPFTGAGLHPGGRSLMLMNGGWLEGIYASAFLARLPAPAADSTVRNTADGVMQFIGPYSGATKARIVWGYNMSLYCTQADEQCVTDSVVSTPRYIGESGNTPHTIGSGVRITVPVQRGFLYFYKIQYLDAGGAVVHETDITSSVG